MTQGVVDQQLAGPAGTTSTTTQYVYFFGDGKADGNGRMKDVLGGKGAGLAEMTNAGLPVPPGFTIQTEACREYMRGKVSPQIDVEMHAEPTGVLVLAGGHPERKARALDRDCAVPAERAGQLSFDEASSILTPENQALPSKAPPLPTVNRILSCARVAVNRRWTRVQSCVLPTDSECTSKGIDDMVSAAPIAMGERSRSRTVNLSVLIQPDRS